jgi:hypothetical protein
MVKTVILEEAGEGPSLRMLQSGRLPANPEPGSIRRMRPRLEGRQVVEETMLPQALWGEIASRFSIPRRVLGNELEIPASN